MWVKFVASKTPLPSIFIDRDGTIVQEPSGPALEDFVVLSERHLPVLSRALHGLQKLSHRFSFFVVSNQDGINRGQISRANYEKQNRTLKKIFKKHGIKVRYWAVCPHTPEEKCACRKPLTGMAKEIGKRFAIDWKHSFMIGDRETDIIFGTKLGMKTIQLKWNEKRYKKTKIKPWKKAPHLSAAADAILKKSCKSPF